MTNNEQNEKLNKLLGTSGVDYFAPSNFVRLQQIYFDCMRVIALSYSDFGSDVVSGFITKFYNFVLYAVNVVPKEVEQFKHQAQQTDWDY